MALTLEDMKAEMVGVNMTRFSFAEPISLMMKRNGSLLVLSFSYYISFELVMQIHICAIIGRKVRFAWERKGSEKRLDIHRIDFFKTIPKYEMLRQNTKKPNQ